MKKIQLSRLCQVCRYSQLWWTDPCTGQIILNKRSLIIGLLICLFLVINACATFKKPSSINETPIKARATTKEGTGIRVSAAVLGDEEARQIFGIDLAQKKIQAVWVEVENSSDRKLVLMPTAIDLEYFAPLEVAFAYHKAFARKANAALDEHLLNLNFPTRDLILPGSRASGYIFTNWSEGMKVIDVDLMGRNFTQNLTFFAPNPDSKKGNEIIDRIDTMFTATELKHVESESALRQALEQLPCCVFNEAGTSTGPLNVVIIGNLDDWTTAFVRRGYIVHTLEPRFAFGRTQDISGRKKSLGYTKAQAQFIRLWQTPIQYQGKTVWLCQVSSRLGGRFADKASSGETLPMDPYLDDARNDLTQDLAYSQALIKIGHVKGSGKTQEPKAGESSGEGHYSTDGLRVVLVFGDRPASLASIDFFDWERLTDYR